MKIYIIIPAHNEEQFLGKTLQSLVNQTVLPQKIVVANDHSTDGTEKIAQHFAATYDFISCVNLDSTTAHMPGSKVVNAFNQGLNTVDQAYDIICKFDADLIFPANYLEQIIHHFIQKPSIGMAGGFCYIQKGNDWVLESLTNKDHIRGALKAYRKECFLAIGGLKPAMGWDTIDELLAQYHKWAIHTDQNLRVQHLKPTGHTYNPSAKFKQGEAFYRMRYGFVITLIASVKLALLKKNPLLIKDYVLGFFKAKQKRKPYLVTKEEGAFIRNLRWRKMKEKLGKSATT